MGSLQDLTPHSTYIVTVEALLDITDWGHRRRRRSTRANCASQGPPIRSTLEASTAPKVMDPIDVVKAKDSTTLMVEFTRVAGATGYIIRIENNAGFFREDHVTSSPAQLGSLEPYTAYSLSIMSKNADGRSQPSTSVEGKTGKVWSMLTNP